MTKGQKIWLVVVLVILILVVAVVVAKGNPSKIFSGSSQPTQQATYPDYCDKERFGYDIYGNQNSDCGVISSGLYLAPCDPDRPGYDINGFPRTDCGYGRLGK